MRAALTGFLQAKLCSLLFHDLHPEGDAAQELIPVVVVAEVGALDPALHGQLLVVVLFSQQQLDGHHGLHVIHLHRGSISCHSNADACGRNLTAGKYLRELSCHNRGNTSYRNDPRWENSASGPGSLSAK